MSALDTASRRKPPPPQTADLPAGKAKARMGGDFYDCRDTDGVGRVYAVHRRSIHPAMRVCKEWGSLLLNENVQVACEDQGATDWLGTFFSAMSP